MRYRITAFSFHFLQGPVCCYLKSL